MVLSLILYSYSFHLSNWVAAILCKLMLGYLFKYRLLSPGRSSRWLGRRSLLGMGSRRGDLLPGLSGMGEEWRNRLFRNEFGLGSGSNGKRKFPKSFSGLIFLLMLLEFLNCSLGNLILFLRGSPDL